LEQESFLTSNQKKVLSAISKESFFVENFYLTGGTALAEFYLKHRLSEDLDFFSQKEFDVSIVSAFLKKYKNELGFKKFDYEQSFNRNLFFIYFPSETLKTEFTYFPFLQIKKPKIVNALKIDSLLDIAVNKAFTIAQKPRTRDFIDLYLILKKQSWDFKEILKKARLKFDWHIDPVNLGTHLLEAKKIKDYPKMLVKINDKDWQEFFLNEAKKLKKDIFK